MDTFEYSLFEGRLRRPAAHACPTCGCPVSAHRFKTFLSPDGVQSRCTTEGCGCKGPAVVACEPCGGIGIQVGTDDRFKRCTACKGWGFPADHPTVASLGQSHLEKGHRQENAERGRTRD